MQELINSEKNWENSKLNDLFTAEIRGKILALSPNRNDQRKLYGNIILLVSFRQKIFIIF